MSILTIHNLHKNYGNKEALSNINLSVSPGEITGFIGPDGAGKTTLFRIIATLLLPGKGTVIIKNFNVITNYKKIRHLLGYMPGKFSLYYDLTVEENLEFFATIFNTSIQENYQLIKEIYQYLEPFKNRQAGKLSGGMKQKLALCCAMIHKPEILILDEPTTGVDAVSRTEFWENLYHLKSLGVTILISTPYMDEATRCDKIALISNGKLLNFDTPENIIQQFNHTLFSIKSNNIFLLLQDLKSLPPHIESTIFGEFIHLYDRKNNLSEQELSTFISSKNYKDVEIKIISPTIEDCFISFLQNT